MSEGLPSVTKDPSVRLPSTWKDPVGKKLTDRKIAEYQAQGKYGELLRLPPKLGEPCFKCGTRAFTKRRMYAYLPKGGFYCQKCVEFYQDERDKVKELNRRIKEAREKEYV